MKEYEMSFESQISKEQGLTFKSAEKAFGEHNIGFGDEKMESLKLVRDGSFTNLGYLLSDQCASGVVISKFADRDRMNPIERIEMNGSLLELYDGTIRAIGEEIYDSFPRAAVEETVKNAIIHRDYSRNGPTLIAMSDRTMEIRSVGGIHQDFCLDDLELGICSERNPLLSSVFRQLGLSRGFGSGIPKVFREYETSVESPGFRMSPNVFSVTLPSLDSERHIPADERATLRLMSERGEIMRSDVGETLGISKSKATNILNGLMEEGAIKRTGTGKSTRYVLSRK